MAWNTANKCSLCLTSCVWCNNGRCKWCGFDPLKVYKVNQVVAWLWEYKLDEIDKKKVKEMIFENKSPEEITPYILWERQQDKQKQVEEMKKIEVRVAIQQKNNDLNNALITAKHKFDWIADKSQCEYCHCSRFYCSNTLCSVRQEMIRKWFAEM